VAQELFGRIGSITVKKKGEATGREFRGLRFSFNIVKTTTADPNIGNITIYNLSKDHRALLEEEDAQIVLRAGYSGFGTDPVAAASVLGRNLAEILYVGDIRLNGIRTERQGPDIASILECSTGIVAMRDAKINKSFGPGTTTLQVIKELVATLGLTISQLQTDGGDVYLGGFSATGSSKDLLTGVLKKLGVDWSIQDDELHIVNPTIPTSEPVVLLTKDTGLIGIPTKRSNGSYVFQSLLNPRIRPGRPLSVVSEVVTGIFRPAKVGFQGDLDGGPWDTTVEAIEVGG